MQTDLLIGLQKAEGRSCTLQILLSRRGKYSGRIIQSCRICSTRRPQNLPKDCPVCHHMKPNAINRMFHHAAPLHQSQMPFLKSCPPWNRGTIVTTTYMACGVEKEEAESPSEPTAHKVFSKVSEASVPFVPPAHQDFCPASFISITG